MKNKITIFNNNNNNNKIIEIDDKLRDLWKKNKVFNNFSPFLILLIVVVAFQFFKLIILFLSVRFDLHFSKQNPEFSTRILLNVFIFILYNNLAYILDWQVRGVERIYMLDMLCMRITALWFKIRLQHYILTFNFSDDAKTTK